MVERLTQKILAGDAAFARLRPLPERVLQFGSGRFLRGFCDALIDEANRSGDFQGRVVVVQSTGSSRSDLLDEQDGLYTLYVRGMEDGQLVEQTRLIMSLSRALSAPRNWPAVLALAASPDLELVVSNTTEAGLALDPQDRLEDLPPRSFPAKLTAFLEQRYRATGGNPESGLVILPCELVDNNGDRLRELCLELCSRWRLEREFIGWLSARNTFCNTLVDRIVTSLPESEEKAVFEKLGYADGLLTVAEPYRLWAIEGGPAVKEKISFAKTLDAVIVVEDIGTFRELKVRLLNGTHTFLVPVAYLSGLETVREAMDDPLLSKFTRTLLRQELCPTLSEGRSITALSAQEAEAYAARVLDRFRNPYLRHLLLDISLQSAAKMRTRNVPTLERHYLRSREVPPLMAFAFACFLLFLRGEPLETEFVGRLGDRKYPIRDDRAAHFARIWKEADLPEGVGNLVERICSTEELWGANLQGYPGFASRVAENLKRCLEAGVRTALSELMEDV